MEMTRVKARVPCVWGGALALVIGLTACGGGGGSGSGGAASAGGSGAAASGGSTAALPANGATAGPLVYASLGAASLGSGASLNGSVPFPADNPWNTDISGAPIDPASDQLIASIGLSTGLHPDFGAGLYAGARIGIPYVVVAGSQLPVAIHLQAYAAESDPGPYPVPPDAPIEGQLQSGAAFSGDRHVLVIDRDRNEQRPDPAAHGDARAAESELRDSCILQCRDPDLAVRTEALRHDRGRQWQQLVHQWCT